MITESHIASLSALFGFSTRECSLHLETNIVGGRSLFHSLRGLPVSQCTPRSGEQADSHTGMGCG